MEIEVYKVLGVMSGTSLDGLDLAYCEFVKGDYWSYHIQAAQTIHYSPKQETILKNAAQLSGRELAALDCKYGKFIGSECKKFIHTHLFAEPSFISSHGHTVFHQPSIGFTRQIGHGAYIQAETGLPVVCDFRSQDVALGGQGAPLVPIGDQLLFGNFQACLNLGGFANISTQIENKRIAWDICAVNVVLNQYANQMGFAFDNRGSIARSGSLHEELLNNLKEIHFYKTLPPKSLGIEWVKEQVLHILEKYPMGVSDILHTYTCHIALEIAKTLDDLQIQQVMITGGGAYNDFLIEKIKQYSGAIVSIPNPTIVEYKEALIFAFLGLLKWRGENNVLCSVTGASKNHSSGLIYGK
jgi:anhydro-N-acetylmuramic acid kinase